MMIHVVCLSLMVHFASSLLLPYPSHASCKINWKFGMTCASVQNKIKDQIELWKGDDCGSGEKCLYKFISYKNNVLKATHETPQKHYVDDLTFTFSENGSGCNVEGFSTSETWYALLDYSTNYCNLRNLMDGSGLSKSTGFMENTSDNVCTQYSSKNCEKY